MGNEIKTKTVDVAIGAIHKESEKMDSKIILERCINEVKEYAKGRFSDVKRGAETPRLAALMLEKYVVGFVNALRCIERDQNLNISHEIQKLGDKLCLEIDPDLKENTKLRWDARPADLNLNP